MLHLRRAAHPLLNLRTLTVPTFRLSQLGMTMYFLVVGAMPFLLPLMFQVQFGWSPVKSGAVTAFVFAGNVGIKPATTPLINRFGFRPLLSSPPSAPPSSSPRSGSPARRPRSR